MIIFVQSLSCVWFFATTWTAAWQSSLDDVKQQEFLFIARDNAKWGCHFARQLGNFLKTLNFPGGPVVKTPGSRCRGPDQGTRSYKPQLRLQWGKKETTKHTFPYDIKVSLVLTQRYWNLYSYKNLHTDIYRNFIHDCKTWKQLICPSVGKWINNLHCM